MMLDWLTEVANNKWTWFVVFLSSPFFTIYGVLEKELLLVAFGVVWAFISLNNYQECGDSE